MQRLTRLLLAIVLAVTTCVTGWLGLSVPAAQATPWLMAQAPSNSADAKLATEFGQKIDLNNTNISSFKEYPGLYPTLAKKIIKNAPYKAAGEVLDLDDLSDRQKSTLEKYLKAGTFVVTDLEPVFNEGDDRINNGVYK